MVKCSKKVFSVWKGQFSPRISEFIIGETYLFVSDFDINIVL